MSIRLISDEQAHKYQLNCIEKDAWYLVKNELLKVSALLCTSIISKYQFKVHMLPTLSLFICPTKMVMVRLARFETLTMFTYSWQIFLYLVINAAICPMTSASNLVWIPLAFLRNFLGNPKNSSRKTQPELQKHIHF